MQCNQHLLGRMIWAVNLRRGCPCGCDNVASLLDRAELARLLMQLGSNRWSNLLVKDPGAI